MKAIKAGVSRGGQGLHIAGHLHDHRNGAQGFGHAAHPCGLLADQTVAFAQVFVGAAGGHHAHAQLGYYVTGPSDRLLLAASERYAERRAFGLHHALGK